MSEPPLLQAARLRVSERPADALGRRRRVRVLDGVEFSLAAGGALGLLGETYSGIPALLDLVLRRRRPAFGALAWEGQPFVRFRRPIGHLPAAVDRAFDPRRTVRAAIDDAAGQAGVPRRERPAAVAAALDLAGLAGTNLAAPPAAFSPTSLHAAALARALAGRPRLLVVDEPGRGLDLPGRALLLNRLAAARRATGLALLLASADPAVIGMLADEVMVLQFGRVVERGPAAAILATPRHPYAAALIAAARAGYERVTGEERAVAGPPAWSPVPPPGCGFQPRCPRATTVCAAIRPELKPLEAGRAAACHLLGAGEAGA